MNMHTATLFLCAYLINRSLFVKQAFSEDFVCCFSTETLRLGGKALQTFHLSLRDPKHEEKLH